ncbi:hypothetical protein QT979_17230, partial [Microcoleus sp. w2-18bC1]
MRSGRYVQQIEGYSAFIPAPLPPEPPIKMDAELHRLLSNPHSADVCGIFLSVVKSWSQKVFPF